MPPKRPLDQLPDVSSSSKEEEEVEDAEEDQEQEQEQDQENDQEEEDQEDDDEEEDQEQEQEQEQESDPDSAGGSDSSPEKPKSSKRSRRSSFIIKPITPKPKNSTPSTTTIIIKRPIENNKSEKESKRIKKKVSDAEEEEEESVKRSKGDPKRPFRRFWSEDDEVVILKGMIDFIKKGHEPFSNTDAFLDFIKKSLHVDANRDQLKDKMRRLRMKYEKNGNESNLLKPHELRLCELSKEIWGEKESKIKVPDTNGGVEFDSGLGRRKRKKSLKAKNSEVLPKPKPTQDFDLHEKPKVSMNGEEGKRTLYPSNESSTMLLPSLGDNLVKEGLRLIESSKAKELEQKWKKLQISEIQVYLKRVELIREQTMLVLDALMSSES